MPFSFNLVRSAVAGDFRIRDMQYPSGVAQHRHGHDEMQISIVLRGSYREHFASGMNEGSSGDLVFKPAGMMHSNDFFGTRIICVDSPAYDADLGGYAWHRGDPAAAAGLHLAKAFLLGENLGDRVDELLAAIAPRAYRDHALAERIARALDERFTSSISLRALAAEIGVHPVYMARAFRARWDCAPREYLHRVRARYAAARLTSSNEPLAAIALDSGFSDQAHMTRVLHRVLGTTPAAMRRLAHM